MFKTALTELDVKPEEALFIDDSIKNVEGAIEMGINSVLMTRENNLDKEIDIISVNNFTDLYNLLNKK